MQSKGLVKFFLIALTLVCAYQYLLILPTNNVERAADRYASDMAAKLPAEQNYENTKKFRAAYLDSMSSEPIFSIPLIKTFTYEELKRTQLAMGLDLKGGMSVLLQVDLQDFLRGMSNNSTDAQFNQALAQASERLKSDPKDYITLFGEEWQKVAGGRKLADIFARNEALKNQIKFETADQEVTRVIREKANATVGETYNRLKQRIDKFGTVQPNVSLDAARDLIFIELPGADNPERIRKIVSKQAKLEFWETYRINDPGISETLLAADQKATALMAGGDGASKTPTKLDSLPIFKTDSLGNVDSSKIVGYKPKTDAATNGAGPLLSKLQVNAQGQLGLAVMGFADKNKMEAISTILAKPEIKQMFPQDLIFRWTAQPMTDEKGVKTGRYELYALKKTNNKDNAPLEGDVVTDAFPQNDPSGGGVSVSLRMNNKGAKTWADLTTKAANNQNREIAVVLDDEVVSAPRVINPITGGESSITGNYTVDEAKDFSNILTVGKLPARTRIVQENLVGPSLGADNISKALTSMGIALGLLILFMVAWYSKGGWVSVVALVANIFFILGALASMGTVLTLPGIAGILLTLAAAVDANVITFERIREELRHGLSKNAAVKAGFTRALPAIIDANVVTFLTAAVLYVFGLGPIKGFGIVLMVGILCSLFTAVLVGRLLTEWWMGRGNDMVYSRPFSEKILTNVHVDWIGKRKYAYIFSGILIAVGIASFMKRGFELGVDFKGGHSYNIHFDRPVELDVLRTDLDQAFGGQTILKAVNTQNTYNVTTSYLINEQDTTVTRRVMGKLHEAVNKYLGGNVALSEFSKTDGRGTHITSSTQVGPTVADDIRSSSYKSALWALGLIFLYLLVRFQRWQFSLGAVVSLLHDVLITLTFFTLLHGIVPFSLEIDQAIIACILTVIGFSVNDTVIVYDRIREYIHTFAGAPKEDVFNRAINSTLSRTLITSGTVFLVVLVLFLFGGSGIRSFAFGMLMGTFFGTYSSIFVASALVVDFTREKVLEAANAVKAAPARLKTDAPIEKPAKTKAKA